MRTEDHGAKVGRQRRLLSRLIRAGIRCGRRLAPIRGAVLLAAGAVIGAAGTAALRPAPEPLRPVEVVLHRFDVRAGEEARLAEWIAYLEANHREAVATLGRERMYVEAMFRLPDEPRRLYWLTVAGAGARSVDTSTAELDRRHTAYMKAVLIPGSHRTADTRNLLMPNFIVAAIRHQQQRVER